MTAALNTPRLTDTVIQQFSMCQGLAKMNIGDIGDQEALFRPQPGANSMSWIIGHVVAVRDALLPVLGEECVLPQRPAVLLIRGIQPVGAEAISFTDLRTAFDTSFERIVAGIGRLTDEALGAKAPFSPSNRPDETMGSLLPKMTFHEAYHIGQLGILRRLLGKKGAA